MVVHHTSVEVKYGKAWRWLPPALLLPFLSLPDGQLSVRWQLAILRSDLDLTVAPEDRAMPDGGGGHQLHLLVARVPPADVSTEDFVHRLMGSRITTCGTISFIFEILWRQGTFECFFCIF